MAEDADPYVAAARARILARIDAARIAMSLAQEAAAARDRYATAAIARFAFAGEPLALPIVEGEEKPAEEAGS